MAPEKSYCAQSFKQSKIYLALIESLLMPFYILQNNDMTIVVINRKNKNIFENCLKIACLKSLKYGRFFFFRELEDSLLADHFANIYGPIILNQVL